MRCDVAIIGGGPVGCFTAAHIGGGRSVVVLEEHSQVGVPEQCAGLIAPRVVQMANAQDTVLNKIDGAVIHFPGGRDVRLKGNETKAFVVERKHFDECCLDLALRNGANYSTGRSFKTLHRGKEGLRLVLQGNEDVLAEMAVGADGYKSSFGRQAGLPTPDEFVKGIQVDLACTMDDQSAVDVWLGCKIAPGFFAWRIPCGDMTRLGLCVDEGVPSEHLKLLMKVAGHEKDRRVRLYSGMIPVAAVNRTSADRILLVGDAAGQVKPISGGGLYPGLTAAKIAGRVATEALDAGDLSGRMLRKYDREWKAVLGRGLDRGHRVRKAFVRMDDRALDMAGKLLDTDDAKRVLSKGDIDHPTDIARDLLKVAPGLMRFAPQLLASMFTG